MVSVRGVLDGGLDGGLVLEAMTAPIVVDGAELYVTASLGVAVADPGLPPTSTTGCARRS